MSRGWALLSAGSCGLGVARTVTWPLVASAPAGIVTLTPFESVMTCRLVASKVDVTALGIVLVAPSTSETPLFVPAVGVTFLTGLTANDLVPSDAVVSWTAWRCHLSPAVVLIE